MTLHARRCLMIHSCRHYIFSRRVSNYPKDMKKSVFIEVKTSRSYCQLNKDSHQSRLTTVGTENTDHPPTSTFVQIVQLSRHCVAGHLVIPCLLCRSGPTYTMSYYIANKARDLFRRLKNVNSCEKKPNRRNHRECQHDKHYI